MVMKKKKVKTKSKSGARSLPPTSTSVSLEEHIVESFSGYVNYIQQKCKKEKTLFRGQRRDKRLLPRTARIKSSFDMLDAEKRMFVEFKRQAIPFLEFHPESDWDWLAIAQHFRMSTRLLDWTLNPLAALWFAVCDPPYKNKQGQLESGVVWIFEPPQKLFATPKFSPFHPTRTAVFQPNHITRRIAVQLGWFTVHKYIEQKSKFIPLERISGVRNYLTKLTIPAKEFAEMRYQLDRFGVNAASLFPDLDGLCNHINWLHSLLEDEKISKPKRLFRKAKKD